MPASRDFQCRLDNLEAAIDAFRNAVADHVHAQNEVTYHGGSERLEKEAAEAEAAARARLLRLFD